MASVAHDIKEGNTIIGQWRHVSTLEGVVIEIMLYGGARRNKWVPFLAFTGLNGGITFALVGPRVRKGSVDADGNTSTSDE